MPAGIGVDADAGGRRFAAGGRAADFHDGLLAPDSLASLLRLPAQAYELAWVSARAGAAYGTSPLAAARRARRARADQGFEYAEALRSGVLDPSLTERERMGFMSKKGTSRQQGRLNPPELMPLTEDKLVFQRVSEQVGLPVPRLYAAVGRSAPWSPCGPVQTAADLARLARDELPDEFVVKPSTGFHGEGVRVVVNDRGRLSEPGGGPLDAAALHRALMHDPRFPCFLVQERLRNHPDVARLGNGRALQTVRLVTLVDRDGGTRVLRGWLRISLGDEVVDNWRGGSTGNGAMTVAEDGELGPLLMPRPDGLGLRPGRATPATGTRLPDWDAVRALLDRASAAFLPIRTIGWDVALTDRGPVLVEANQSWDPFPEPTPGLARAITEA